MPKYSESPGQDESGISRITKSYHGNTHIIARLDEFSLTNVPCLYGNTGVWHKVTLCDIAGRITNECFYSVAGLRVNGKDKYAEGWIKYDENDNIIDVVAFDAEGKKVVSVDEHNPVEGRITHAEQDEHPDDDISMEVSPSAVATQTIFQGLDLSGVGSVRIKLKTHNGKTVRSGSFTVLDANQRQMLIPNGFSEGKIEKGDNEEFRRLDFYALPDKGGIFGCDNIHHEVQLFDNKGRNTNECYFAVSGAPTTNRWGMIRCETEYGASGERSAILGYDASGSRYNGKMFVGVNMILPDSPAEKGGMRKGDVICAFLYGTNVLDFTSGTLSDSTFAQWQELISAAKEYEKKIVFAHKSAEDLEILSRTFPKGVVGFQYGLRLSFEQDYVKLQDAWKRFVKNLQGK